MSAQTTIDAPPPSSRHALPDPGQAVPTLSWPTVGLFFGALALFVVSSWAASPKYDPQNKEALRAAGLRWRDGNRAGGSGRG